MTRRKMLESMSQTVFGTMMHGDFNKNDFAEAWIEHYGPKWCPPSRGLHFWIMRTPATVVGENKIGKIYRKGE